MFTEIDNLQGHLKNEIIDFGGLDKPHFLASKGLYK